ncbi:HAMP domain-containing histidine kinase [bacterium]|nr:HAMP domain-containing histidine kinase [bacterium]
MPAALGADPGFEVYRERSRWASYLGMASLSTFSLAQAYAFFEIGTPEVIDRAAASVSVALNLVAAACVAAYYVVNFVAAPRLGWDFERTWRISVHALMTFLMLFAVAHIHIAGSTTTVLPVMFVTISLVNIWVVGPRAGWTYFFLGIAGWGLVTQFERVGWLGFLPLHARAAEVSRDIFLESRYVGMTMALFVGNGLFILAMAINYTRQLQMANARLDFINRELAATNERLSAAEMLRDDLTNMIVHDLRSPLVGLQMNLQAMKRKMPDDPALADRFERTMAGANQQLEMINDLLDINRLESGEMVIRPAPADLERLAHEAVTSLGAFADGRKISIEASPEAAPATCDPDLVKRIIANFVGNAVKFTPRGGPIAVRIDETNGSVRVRVCDVGPGIPREDQDRIFRKFGQAELRGQRRQHSTGLGLAFCKLVIDAHRGDIGVESVVGQGSTFWFTLPKA